MRGWVDVSRSAHLKTGRSIHSVDDPRCRTPRVNVSGAARYLAMHTPTGAFRARLHTEAATLKGRLPAHRRRTAGAKG